MTLQAFLSRFNGVSPDGNSYKAICPVCGGEEAKVRIWIEQDSQIRLECEGGCSPSWILDSFQLAVNDLLLAKESPDSPNTSGRSAGDSKESDQQEDKNAKGKRRRQSAADRLVELASDGEFFKSPENVGYVHIPFGDHYEVWPVKSKEFRRWLSSKFYSRFDGVPGAQAMQDAINHLEGRASFDGETYQIYRRVAPHEDGIYLDLCDERWRSVKITAKGWEVTTDTPVRFHRAPGMLALPEPQRGGSINDLWQFCNAEQADRGLVKALIHSYYRPQGPYAICAMHGEQGTAKSTNARVLRQLVDPNTAPLRCEPKNARELMIAANNSWIIALDNLSMIPDWLSDALCRLATGSGFSTRELYSDSDETILQAQRPIILTGIENIVTRNDLLDRSIVLDLPVITEWSRRAEEDFWREFEIERPRIIGAFLDAISVALRYINQIKLQRSPRLADFVKWTTAAEEELGFEKEGFIELYTSNRQLANIIALEGSPISSAIIKFIEQSNGWEGTAAELLTKLDMLVSDGSKRLRSWPKCARTLSSAFKRLAPNLRAIGIIVTYHRTASRRIISIEKVCDSSSLSSSSSFKTVSQQVTSENRNDNVTQSDYGKTQGVSPLSSAKFIERKEEFTPDDVSDDNDTNKRLHSCGIHSNSH